MTSQLVYNFSSSRAERNGQRNGIPIHKHNSEGKIEYCHVFENIEYDYTPVYGYISEIKYSYVILVVITGKVIYDCKHWLNPVNLSNI